MKRLRFEWCLGEDVPEIKEEDKQIRITQLDNMLIELKEKLLLLNNVNIEESDTRDYSGLYYCKTDKRIKPRFSISMRMRIIISKEGRKTTWNDIMRTVNTIKAPYYEFI